MDRFTKINEIKNLKDAINKQKHLVEEELKRLHSLESEYARASIIELPILLFTLKDDKNYPLYVYYYADLDKVVFLSKENEILPNVIDLRSVFTNIGIPPVINQENIVECSEKIDIVTSSLTTKIDELFSQYDIKSWYELGIYLQSLKPEDYNFTNSLNNEKVLK